MSRLAICSMTAFIAGALLMGPADADADIYKYKKPDGTVTYTNSLADLPVERRRYYNQRKQEQEAKRAQLERKIGKDELARREAEAQRERLLRDKAKQAEAQAQLAELDARIAAWKTKSRQRDEVKTKWQNRLAGAKQKLETALAEFKEAEGTYQSIAMKASHTLFPGQAQQRDEALKKMTELEVVIDALIEEIEVTIPDEARKAGIPPGWLRD